MHRRTIHRTFRRFILFFLQGPLMPWWGFPLGLILGLIVFLMCHGSSVIPSWTAWIGLALAVMHLFWIFTRKAQYEYYRSIALRTGRERKCLSCAYPFDGISPDRCSECGLVQAEFIDRARRIAVEYPAPLRKDETS